MIRITYGYETFNLMFMAELGIDNVYLDEDVK